MRLTQRILRPVASLYEQYSNYHPTPLTIKKLLDFGKEANHVHSFVFLRKELPVRLATIIREIKLLPPTLLEMPSVKVVEGWYWKSFEELSEYINVEQSHSTVSDFTATLEEIITRHATVVETMAQGVLELKDSYGISGSTENRIQYFLDRFFMSRISIRMLINQHLLLFGDSLTNNPRHIGSIDPSCDVTKIVREAYEGAAFLCNHYYSTAPDINVQLINSISPDQGVQMVYVPSHLYHVLFEVFKNAMRAVVEYHRSADELPAVAVTVCKGHEDVTVKISDQGGGIARSKQQLLFNYMYSTAPTPRKNETQSAMAGYGFGLPISRLYAKYLHGDLNLSSAEGYGTDVLLCLKVFPADAEELLPVFSVTSAKQYSSDIPVSDWTDPLHTTGLHSPRHKGS